MSNSDILSNKRRNFLELNKEIEEKVQNLVQEVDLIIDKQENFMRIPNRSTLFISTREPMTDQLKQSDENIYPNQSLFNNKYENKKENWDNDNREIKYLGEKKNSINETIIRFLKAQITKLQSDIKVSQYETKKMNERCRCLEAELQKHEEQKEKFISQLSSCRESISKNEDLNSTLQTKIQLQNTEIGSLKKEIESLKREIKHLNHISSNSEIRFNRSLEENEKLRLSIKTSQSEEKELREQMRKMQEEKRSVIKNLERQRIEILQAFQKQIQLIDNLKKQKAFLEATRGIQFVEEDFTKLLEWKPDKKK